MRQRNLGPADHVMTDDNRRELPNHRKKALTIRPRVRQVLGERELERAGTLLRKANPAAEPHPPTTRQYCR